MKKPIKIYTSIFKTCHLDIESEQVNLSDGAFIEKSSEYSGKLVSERFELPPMMMSNRMDSQFDLSKFCEDLINSEIRLRVRYIEEKERNQPFARDHCSYIAVALSILCDSWFVVGLEEFDCHDSPNPPSIGPHTTYFLDNDSEGSANIDADQENELRDI